MTIILLASLAIVFTIIVLAGFSGFVVVDNVDNLFIIIAAAIVPASVAAYLLGNPFAALLWGAAFITGGLVADIIEAGRDNY
jgi:hypothetical protein